MQVLLRHASIGLYYAGHKHWVGNPAAALNLGSVEHAAEVSREECFSEMQVLLKSDDPSRDLVLPLRRKQPGTAPPAKNA
jgi:hypothetical protein